MQVCTSFQTDNHASTPLLSFLQARCPSCRPTNSVKAEQWRKKVHGTWQKQIHPKWLLNGLGPVVPKGLQEIYIWLLPEQFSHASRPYANKAMHKS